MTKALRIFLFAAVLGFAVCIDQPAKAQCAMCSATVESGAAGGSSKTSGLNSGIIYLLAMPYIAVAIGGFVWYKKYRKKNVTLQMRDERLHLN